MDHSGSGTTGLESSIGDRGVSHSGNSESLSLIWGMKFSKR